VAPTRTALGWRTAARKSNARFRWFRDGVGGPWRSQVPEARPLGSGPIQGVVQPRCVIDLYRSAVRLASPEPAARDRENASERGPSRGTDRYVPCDRTLRRGFSPRSSEITPTATATTKARHRRPQADATPSTRMSKASCIAPSATASRMGPAFCTGPSSSMVSGKRRSSHRQQHGSFGSLGCHGCDDGGQKSCTFFVLPRSAGCRQIVRGAENRRWAKPFYRFSSIAGRTPPCVLIALPPPSAEGNPP